MKRGGPKAAPYPGIPDDLLLRCLRGLGGWRRTENGGALVIRQRAGDDFGGRGRAAIDQHDDWLAVGQVARTRRVTLRLFGIAAARRNDLAALKERIRHRDRLVEQAA